MKALSLPLLAILLNFSQPAWGDEADWRSPKAEDPRLIRVLLYIPGTSRLIDYPDVERIFSSDRDRIVFETQDRQVVVHQGPFTIIRPRSATSSISHGPRFYDLK